MKTSNKSNKGSKVEKSKNVIIGIMQLFAVSSIAYSTVVIIIGTDGLLPVFLVTPQVLLAVTIAINKFSK